MAKEKVKKPLTQEDIQSLTDEELIEAFSYASWLAQYLVMFSVKEALFPDQFLGSTTAEITLRWLDKGELLHLEVLRRLFLNKSKKQDAALSLAHAYWERLRSKTLKKRR